MESDRCKYRADSIGLDRASQGGSGQVHQGRGEGRRRESSGQGGRRRREWSGQWSVSRLLLTAHKARLARSVLVSVVTRTRDTIPLFTTKHIAALAAGPP